MPAARPTQVLVLTPDTVGPAMAGPGIRSYELARVLSAESAVTLASPYPVGRELPGAVTTTFADQGQLRQLVGQAEVVVAMASLLHEHRWIGQATGASGRRPAVVADAYDPVLFEVLAMSTGAGFDTAVEGPEALARMTTPLELADLVLCASTRQRHLLLGMMAGLGRVNPLTYTADPTFERFVSVVPFGLPNQPADAGGRRPLRGPEGPFDADDFVVLWGGGLYEWLDPVTLVEAIAQVDDPHVKAYLLAGPHPTPAVPASSMAIRTRRRADELGLTRGPAPRVVFGDRWVPYDERAAWLLDADASVSLHRPGLEATFAFRTRLLDALWTRLPVICTEGDTLAELVHRQGLGVTVAPSDPTAVAQAIVTLREPRCYAAARLALGSIAPFYAWDRVAQPLVEFCRHPALAPDRTRSAPALETGAKAQAMRVGIAVGRWSRAAARRGAARYDEYRTRQREQT
jgi:Glycosyl transferases group 1